MALQEPNAAAQELTHCVKELGFCGAQNEFWDTPATSASIVCRAGSPHGQVISWRFCPSFHHQCIEATPMKNLAEAVQQYGYAKKKKIKLYGKELEIVSDPVNHEGDEVFVEARVEGTEDVKRVQVPRNVVEMAKGSRRNDAGQ